MSGIWEVYLWKTKLRKPTQATQVCVAGIVSRLTVSRLRVIFRRFFYYRVKWILSSIMIILLGKGNWLVYSTNRSKAVVPVLVLFFVALWFILRGNLFYVLPCVILFLCFSVLISLRLPRLGKRELILVLFVRLFDLRLFGFVCFLFLLVSGKGCDL